MQPEKILGQVLRRQRLALGMSQEGLALEAGLQRNYISLLERGAKSATLRTLFKLSPVLRMPVSDMVREVEQRLLTHPDRPTPR